jgi:hypothetical protein
MASAFSGLSSVARVRSATASSYLPIGRYVTYIAHAVIVIAVRWLSVTNGATHQGERLSGPLALVAFSSGAYLDVDVQIDDGLRVLSKLGRPIRPVDGRRKGR